MQNKISDSYKGGSVFEQNQISSPYIMADCLWKIHFTRRMLSTGYDLAVSQKFENVSEETTASIFRAEADIQWSIFQLLNFQVHGQHLSLHEYF